MYKLKNLAWSFAISWVILGTIYKASVAPGGSGIEWESGYGHEEFPVSGRLSPSPSAFGKFKSTDIAHQGHYAPYLYHSTAHSESPDRPKSLLPAKAS